MGLFSSSKADKKSDKSNQIHLQNIVFNTNENDLMVSPAFLKEMTDRYAGKRLAQINKNLSAMSNTKSPIRFFQYCDIIDTCISELCQIEPYYKFKKPVPSEFKGVLASKHEHTISTMFNRAWKSILNKASLVDGVPKDTLPFEELLREMMMFEDRLAPVHLAAIEMYKNSLTKNQTAEDKANLEAMEETMLENDDGMSLDMDLDMDDMDIDELEI